MFIIREVTMSMIGRRPDTILDSRQVLSGPEAFNTGIGIMGGKNDDKKQRPRDRGATDLFFEFWR